MLVEVVGKGKETLIQMFQMLPLHFELQEDGLVRSLVKVLRTMVGAQELPEVDEV